VLFAAALLLRSSNRLETGGAAGRTAVHTAASLSLHEALCPARGTIQPWSRRVLIVTRYVAEDSSRQPVA